MKWQTSKQIKHWSSLHHWHSKECFYITGWWSLFYWYSLLYVFFQLYLCRFIAYFKTIQHESYIIIFNMLQVSEQLWGNSTFLWVCTISELYVRSRPVTTGSVTFKGLHRAVKYFISIHFCIIKWLEART